VGVDGLTFKASGRVMLNKATDAAGLATSPRINWFTATNSTNDPDSLIPAFGDKLTSSVELFIEGSVDLDLFGFVLATGSFEMTQQSGLTISDSNGISLTNASMLTVSLSNLNFFVGVGASLDENGTPENISDDMISTDGAVGFEVSDASLDMAIVKEDPQVGVRSWTGLSAHVGGMGVVGLPGSFELYVRELDLLYNIAAADTTKMNWAGVSQVSATQLVNLPKTLDFKVSGSLDLNISGFVLAAGTFEISKETGLSINDGTVDLTNVSLLKVSLKNVYLFVGVGGGFARDADSIVTGFDFDSSTVGFQVSGASLDLAILSEDPAAMPAPRSWTAVAAHVDSMGIVGLPSTFELNVRALDLQYNVADSSASAIRLNWDDLTTDGLVSGFGGIVSTLELKVSGSLDLNISGFVLAAGTFEVTKQSGLAINDGTINLTNASLLTISLSEVYLFVGVGGAFARDGDSIVTGFDFDSSTVGFQVSGASLDLAILSEDPAALPAPRSWTAVAARVDSMGIVGLPSTFELNVRALDLQYNVADSSASPTRLNWDDLTTDGLVSGFGGIVSTLELKVSGSLDMNISRHIRDYQAERPGHQ